MKSLTAFLILALISSPALAGREPWTYRETRHHHALDHVSKLAQQYGWGCDSQFGCYVGPIFEGKRKGYFRCLMPGNGWRRC
jgi:hypothetical protein